MPAHPIEEDLLREAAEAVSRTGSIRGAAQSLKINISTLRHRIVEAKRRGIEATPVVFTEFPNWLKFQVQNGHVLIASDAHYWPGFVSTAHRALVHFAKKFQPKMLIMNGDVCDFATISRHPPIGWEKRPSVESEIKAAQDRLRELERAAPNAKRVWSLGNHDSRLETRLATVAPEFAKINGVHLHDHFPGWLNCWSALINDDVVVKHRFKNGAHAVHNATLWAGKTMVTGHLHSLKVSPISDYRGTRWGVDTGTLADPYGPQFEDYCEQNPVSWRSGFAVLTFRNGRLMWPELAHVIGERKIDFRGEIVHV